MTLGRRDVLWPKHTLGIHSNAQFHAQRPLCRQSVWIPISMNRYVEVDRACNSPYQFSVYGLWGPGGFRSHVGGYLVGRKKRHSWHQTFSEAFLLRSPRTHYTENLESNDSVKLQEIDRLVRKTEFLMCKLSHYRNTWIHESMSPYTSKRNKISRKMTAVQYRRRKRKENCETYSRHIQPSRVIQIAHLFHLWCNPRRHLLWSAKKKKKKKHWSANFIKRPEEVYAEMRMYAYH